MHGPELAIMDEPTSGLDPLVQNEFYELLEERREAGRTNFFSSHILSEVRRVCDRVGIIRNGRLIELDTVENILAEGGTIATVRLAEEPPTAALEFRGVARVDRQDGTYRLVLAREFDALIDRLSEYTVLEMEVREASIEDVFMHFTETWTRESPIPMRPRSLPNRDSYVRIGSPLSACGPTRSPRVRTRERR